MIAVSNCLRLLPRGAIAASATPHSFNLSNESMESTGNLANQKGTSSATTRVDFTKIKKSGSGNVKKNVSQTQSKGRKDPFALFTAQFIDGDDEALPARSRFQLLAEAKSDGWFYFARPAR